MGVGIIALAAADIATMQFREEKNPVSILPNCPAHVEDFYPEPVPEDQVTQMLGQQVVGLTAVCRKDGDALSISLK